MNRRNGTHIAIAIAVLILAASSVATSGATSFKTDVTISAGVTGPNVVSVTIANPTRLPLAGTVAVEAVVDGVVTTGYASFEVAARRSSAVSVTFSGTVTSVGPCSIIQDGPSPI